MGKIVVGSGRSRVEISGTLADGLLDTVRDAVGAEVLDEILTTAERVRDESAETWPVRTGKSRDSLEASARIPGDPYVVDGTITSIYYARYIISSKVGKNYAPTMRARSPIVEMRRKVLDERPGLQRRVKEAIVRRLQEVTGG